jgi:hypothetical protein
MGAKVWVSKVIFLSRNKRKPAIVGSRRMRTIPVLLVLICSISAWVSGCSSPTRTEAALMSSLDGITAKAVNTRRGSTLSLETAGGAMSLDLEAPVKQVLLARLDGKPCLAVLMPDEEQTVRLYELQLNRPREIWRGISGSLKPWKVQIADVDGDGREEIAVGVYKKARFHPVMAKRPFVYGWDGEDIYPKWLGSRLSRPFTDFVLADFGEGPAKVIAVEETKDGANELAVYSWHGFGFIRNWAGAGAEKLTDLRVSGPAGRQRIAVTAGDTDRVYSWDGRELTLEGSE